jgi:hypothetical protein
MANSLNHLGPNITSTLQKSSTDKHKNRRSLILLLMVFMLPILLAKLALDNEWLNSAVTNQGTLLTQPLTLLDLGIADNLSKKQWLILYKLPSTCSEICLQTIEIVHNSYVLLGKNMPRVTPILLANNIFSEQQRQQLNKSQWQILELTPQMNNLLITPQILIADPLGNIILSHQLPVNTQQQGVLGKAIIADMKKLLKYSKVG